jgi:hypothetical protein
VAADFRSPPLIIRYVHRSGTFGWDVPAVCHVTFHTIMTTMPTATQASRPHKNQDASRSSSRVKLIIMQHALENLHRLDWQYQAFHFAAYPKTDIIVEATALIFSKGDTFYPVLKGTGLIPHPIYNCGANREL